jgi:predicted Abi (CAAX) family protease
MDQLIAAAWRRLLRSLITWPSARGWAFAGAMGVCTLVCMGALGCSTGLYALQPANTHGLALRLLSVVIVPALGEEAVFRGVLIPDRFETSRPWLWLPLGVGVFTLWHVVEATTFLPAARAMFLRPDFLSCAALLGAGCAVIRWRTGSLWPCVILHWTMVTIWQTWLGGFTL